MYWFKNIFVLTGILTAILLLPLVWFIVLYGFNTVALYTRLTNFPIYLWCLYGGLMLACIGEKNHDKRIVIMLFAVPVAVYVYYIWLYMLRYYYLL